MQLIIFLLLVDWCCSPPASILQPGRRGNVWRNPPQAAAAAAREVWRCQLSPGGASAEGPAQASGGHRWLCEFSDSSRTERTVSPPWMNVPMWCPVLHLQLEIKNHVFFTPINWDDLYHKRITPPYNPNVVSVSVVVDGFFCCCAF